MLGASILFCYPLFKGLGIAVPEPFCQALCP
nr:MAG TPA: hypothetical protein [Bacteriophage sp.]